MYRLLVLLMSTCLMAGCAKGLYGRLPGHDGFIAPSAFASLDSQADALLTPYMDRTTRDAFVTNKIAVIDHNYRVYEQEIKDSQDGTKFAGSIATIGLSTAATLIPLGATTRALTATVGAIGGAQKAVDTELLEAQTIPSLIRVMHADRDTVYTLITDRLSLCDETQYPVSLAIADLEAYRSVGTIEAALVSLGNKTAALAVDARNLKNAKVETFPGQASLAAGTSSDPHALSIARCPIERVRRRR